jgi:hypothetical protein
MTPDDRRGVRFIERATVGGFLFEETSRSRDEQRDSGIRTTSAPGEQRPAWDPRPHGSDGHRHVRAATDETIHKAGPRVGQPI